MSDTTRQVFDCESASKVETVSNQKNVNLLDIAGSKEGSKENEHAVSEVLPIAKDQQNNLPGLNIDLDIVALKDTLNDNKKLELEPLPGQRTNQGKYSQAELDAQGASLPETKKPAAKTNKDLSSSEDLKATDALPVRDEKIKEVTQYLTRFEQTIIRGLTDAIEDSKIDDISEMLRGISPLEAESQERILNSVKLSLQESGRYVAWETGQSNSGQSFLRLHISRNANEAKSAHTVTIGSDGLTSGAYISLNPRRTVDPQIALNSINDVPRPRQPKLR